MELRDAFAAAGLALALTSAPAAAQTASDDVKCLLAANLFVKAEKDPGKHQVAVLSSYYYLGRVDARLSGAQLSAALKAQAPTITAENAGPTMTSCAKRVQGSAMAIQTLGKSLTAPK
ncbi:hypothetical protein GON01_00785 [Sphingomonas sp. MAH-20]|jgi:hypothetical protein|uniref:Uncharacterized protein n=1 Tax=Sphingomonas horti TaxID=2682842 RepID=A0A6I4IWM6_9SPHN|nr:MULTISPECIES: hypothetical protein [Sphingomonas]MBA2920221.1 hypothetical protein [Sphingomonas sp. CGMCC 1.13658]MVO76476.1 hypothetical protein [Sphingomonas horti]